MSSSSSSTKLYHEFHQCFFFKPFQEIKLTIIPPRQLFVNISSDEEVTTTPSPTTTSSSPTPPDAPSKTPSINQTSLSQDNTSSSFQSKLRILPPSSNKLTSPQPLNPLLENILDVPPKPLNPQPLQIPLENLSSSPSPSPPPPPPQPPFMGHLLYYNYHGSTACVFTDRWRLDELAYGIPSDGPYQTNPPSIEDIILTIRTDREGQSENHEGIVAREEVIIPLLRLPPSINHPYPILTMMMTMEIMKGPCVQALLPLFAMSVP
ncbi:hypothetical protein Tco_0866989 [Tanacetum coccineum]